MVATTAILPPWLRRYKETIPSRSTRYGITSLQVDLAARRRPKFTELTAHNLKILCDALELRFPGQGDIVPAISSTVLLCRSGMARKQPSSLLSTTTWLLFRGSDSDGKTAVALELARLVFGSHTEFTALQAGNSDEPTRSGKLTHKRRRSPGDRDGGYPGARLFKAIVENPHRVIYIDGVDRLDRDSEMRIKDAMVEGTARGCNGEVVDLDDAIVVLCSDVVSPPRVKRRVAEGDATGKEVRPHHRLGLDLNACPEDREDEEDNLADGEEILNFVDGVFFFN